MDTALAHPSVCDALLQHLDAHACARLTLTSRALRDEFIEEATNYRSFKTYGFALRQLFAPRMPTLPFCAEEVCLEIFANDQRVESQRIAAGSFQEFEQRLALAVCSAKPRHATFRIMVVCRYSYPNSGGAWSGYNVYERAKR